MQLKKTLKQLTPLGLLALAPALFGHGKLPEKYDAASDGEINMPHPGMESFANAIQTYSRSQFNALQMATMEEVREHLQFASEIRAGDHVKYEAVDAAYHLSAAQVELLKLLEEELPDLRTMDLRGNAGTDDIMDPVPLPALKGAVFLKIMTGGEKIEFRTLPVNMTRHGDGGPLNLNFIPNGTTYYLLGFEELPSDLSRIFISFTPDGAEAPTRWSGLSIEAPASGQFKLTILDENGSVTPALVRLVEKATGRLWAPPNAVDIWPIMTAVRGFPDTDPVEPYMHYFMNGKIRGHYWIAPESFEMALPAGDWELYVVHGIEYEPVITSFTVEEKGWTSHRVQLKRWVDMPSRGWYSGDDHVHARMMSSKDAEDIMAFVKAADIKVANILEMGDPARTHYEQRGFGKAYRVIDDGHVLVPGQEDPRSDFGHAIGMNLTKLARDLDKYMLNDWVADEIHRQGGLYGHTHVGEGGLGVHRDMTMLLPRGKSDFGSIMQNILGTERYYDFLNLGFKLTASAGSDTPYGGAVGITRLYAFLGEQEFSADAWFDAVKKGNTFVTNGPMLDMRVNGQLPGETILLDTENSVHIRAKAWGLSHMSAPKRFYLVRNGEIIGEQKITNPEDTKLSFELDVETGTGCWIAVGAEGLDGTQAHTTPVYIHKKGFRHWNIETASQLIDERMATLDEMDALVTAKKQAYSEGHIQPMDYVSLLIVEQAEAIMERTQYVRGLYRELRATLNEELNAPD